MAKLKMTPELWKVVDDAAQEALNPNSEREEYDPHKWAHRIADRIIADHPELIQERRPSDSDIAESLAGAMLAARIANSKRRPRLALFQLRSCQSKEVVPEELILLHEPSKKLVARADLYASEQMAIAKGHKKASKKQKEIEKFELALAKPFLEWEAEQLAAGRPATHLTQMTYWMESGNAPPPAGTYAPTPASPLSPAPPTEANFDPVTGEVFEPAE